MRLQTGKAPVGVGELRWPGEKALGVGCSSVAGLNSACTALGAPLGSSQLRVTPALVQLSHHLLSPAKAGRPCQGFEHEFSQEGLIRASLLLDLSYCSRNSSRSWIGEGHEGSFF